MRAWIHCVGLNNHSKENSSSVVDNATWAFKIFGGTHRVDEEPVDAGGEEVSNALSQPSTLTASLLLGRWWLSQPTSPKQGSLYVTGQEETRP